MSSTNTYIENILSSKPHNKFIWINNGIKLFVYNPDIPFLLEGYVKGRL
jgi:hypothetical protein